ncbi:MAG: RNA 3'-terminal phosphate cyclase [Vicinamibacteria bacterium]
MTLLELDGSVGEGGGQILRTALSLSALTGRPFTIDRIRANRKKPGLLRQHLTAVRAAAAVCGASVRGDEPGSQSLSFEPGPVTAGEYRFAIGTAGSTTLVMQTVLPPLLTAAGPSRVTIEGGTHNPLAPPVDFFERSFLPFVRRMGPRVSIRLERCGFYPAGGGRIVVDVEPVDVLAPFELTERAPVVAKRARALVAGLPRRIAERELAVAQEALGLASADLEVVEIAGGQGPGNVLSIELEMEHHREVFTGFGEQGVRAEAVAAGAVAATRAYLAGGDPVGEHLADQLVIPLAMSGAGRFRTGPASRHLTTNVEVVARFLEVPIVCVEYAPRRWEVGVGPA